jgi:hypothetical protein
VSWQPIRIPPEVQGEYLCVTTGCPWWPEKPWPPQVEFLNFYPPDSWTNDEGVERIVTYWMPPPELPK